MLRWNPHSFANRYSRLLEVGSFDLELNVLAHEAEETSHVLSRGFARHISRLPMLESSQNQPQDRGRFGTRSRVVVEGKTSYKSAMPVIVAIRAAIEPWWAPATRTKPQRSFQRCPAIGENASKIMMATLGSGFQQKQLKESSTTTRPSRCKRRPIKRCLFSRTTISALGICNTSLFPGP